MVADNGPLYAYVDIFPATIVIYNIKQCLHCISDEFDVILMAKNVFFFQKQGHF